MQESCRILVMISGNGSNLQAVIDSCDSKMPGRVVGVISNKADAYGLIRAHHAEIDTSCVIARKEESRAQYDARLQAAIDRYQPDLIVLAGFMRILSDDWSAVTRARCSISTRHCCPSILDWIPQARHRSR